MISTFVLLGSLAVAGAELMNHFNDPEVDKKVWNFCQADPALIGFGTEMTSGRTSMALRIDGEREDSETCTRASQRGFIDQWDTLGPNFFPESLPANTALPEPACALAELRNGEPIAQRNEVRFAQRELHPPVENDTWYFITFKLRGYDGDQIPACGSARWVIGQWKYQHMAPGSDGSPFLAQRFGNGVLHVTVEDNGCRCMIAKAGGDPDLMRLRQKLALPGPSQLNKALPLECRYSSGGSINGRCEPAHLVLKAQDMGHLSTLPDPKRDWVDMACARHFGRYVAQCRTYRASETGMCRGQPVPSGAATTICRRP